MPSKKYLKMIILITITILLTLTACNDINMKSKWRDKPIVIDGFQNDWEGLLMSLPKAKVNIGVLNDNEFLYLCLIPLDQEIARQAMAMGMTVWFEGHSENKIGLHYPLGLPFKDMEPGELKENKGDQARQKLYDNSLREIQVIDGDKNILAKISSVNTVGIEAQISNRYDRFVYELKVPLWITVDYPYAINATTGKDFKIKFETPKMELRSMRKKPGGGDRPDGGMMPPGGIGGGGMGGGRPGGMRGGPDQPRMPEPLKLEMKIKLADNVASGSGQD